VGNHLSLLKRNIIGHKRERIEDSRHTSETHPELAYSLEKRNCETIIILLEIMNENMQGFK